jgi:predicted phosphodiesterase
VVVNHLPGTSLWSVIIPLQKLLGPVDGDVTAPVPHIETKTAFGNSRHKRIGALRCADPLHLRELTIPHKQAIMSATLVVQPHWQGPRRYYPNVDFTFLTMKVRYLSDLHNELSVYLVHPHAEDAETILILAGDISTHDSDPMLPWMENLCARFKHVFYIAGNHECYNGIFPTAFDGVAQDLLGITNLDVGQQLHRVIDDVLFVGATLWTDVGNNYSIISEVQHGINDYRLIKIEDAATGRLRRLTTHDTQAVFMQNRKFIGDKLAARSKGQKSVVFTHHAPHPLSIQAEYKGDVLNAAYYTDMDKFIVKYQPDVWIHGHMHATIDYHVEKTRILANARGYSRYQNRQENRNFDPQAHVII